MYSRVIDTISTRVSPRVLEYTMYLNSSMLLETTRPPPNPAVTPRVLQYKVLKQQESHEHLWINKLVLPHQWQRKTYKNHNLKTKTRPVAISLSPVPPPPIDHAAHRFNTAFVLLDGSFERHYAPVRSEHGTPW